MMSRSSRSVERHDCSSSNLYRLAHSQLLSIFLVVVHLSIFCPVFLSIFFQFSVHFLSIFPVFCPLFVQFSCFCPLVVHFSSFLSTFCPFFQFYVHFLSSFPVFLSSFCPVKVSFSEIVDRTDARCELEITSSKSCCMFKVDTMSSLSQDLPALPPLGTGDRWSPSRFRINSKSHDELGDVVDKEVAENSSQDPFWPPGAEEPEQGLAFDGEGSRHAYMKTTNTQPHESAD